MKRESKTNKHQVNSIETVIDAIDFPIVGIGASAGGLEAIQDFFKTISADIGCAFVIVQHLSPDYKSFMSELLSRYTSLPIEVVKDGTRIEINHIYLIPPKTNMTIFHGVLYLNELGSIKTLNLPIDIFFRSLAKDQEKNAIGIVLSGTGSDGTLGIKAIKEAGGMTMVQDEKSAKFDGMPRSSIATGMVDIVMAPHLLADELLNYIKHPFIRQSKFTEILPDKEQTYLKKVIHILNTHKNVDFSLYKENSIIRRLEKRISINRFEKVEDYTNFLANNNKEINILFNELLIGVTRFFRDETFFNRLMEIAFPKLFENSKNKKEIRIWVTACSTGEEAYSLGILLKEYMLINHINKEIKIFATDLDTNSLEVAGIGYYPDNIMSDVTTERLCQFFTRKGNGYQVNENLRSMLIFARHNLLYDPPFSKIDLITCRNLLIYLNSEVQSKVISTFNSSLNEHGILFLGSSESLGNAAYGYITIDNKAKIFQKQLDIKTNLLNYSNNSEFNVRHELLHYNQLNKAKANSKARLLESMFDQLMETFLPPSVIINNSFEVIHSIGNINAFLKIPSGQLSTNILKMLPNEYAIAMSSALHRSEKTDNEVFIETFEKKDSATKLEISCKKINDKLTDSTYYFISFHEKNNTQKGKRNQKSEKLDLNTHFHDRIHELEKELQLKGETLQATVEELETSNEELQSSNEELIASNEELQSTNEELQSVNEELYTVNSEHIKKIDELSELTNDFENLLKNTKIGHLYLDTKLNIRKINEVASEITNILPTDIGRPITHLALKNLYNHLVKDIEEVSNSLQFLEREIPDKLGNFYLTRIFPYRTNTNAVEGTIITFVDITSFKNAKNVIIDITERLDNALDMGMMSWWEWDFQKGTYKTGINNYYLLGYDPDEIPDTIDAWQSLVHPEDLPVAKEAIAMHIKEKSTFYITEYRIKHKSGIYIDFREKGRVYTRDEYNNPKIIIGIVMKIEKSKD